MSGAAIVIDGMHGLGDNVHQRAVIRRVLAAGRNVWLKTPWPCMYHDLVGERLHLIDRGRTLRTQAKNAARERASYTPGLPPIGATALRVWYDYTSVRRAGSFLGGMIRTTLNQAHEGADFTLPVPLAWRDKAEAMVGRHSKPIMVLRPLVERKEWGGCSARNPAPVAYAQLVEAMRVHFHVVSIADLVPGVEWMVGPEPGADVRFHAGELDAEAIAGLMSMAALTVTSPGFAIALSQAVGTPVIAIFGGHESSRLYRYGARFAPTLGIDPVNPCECFSRYHRCDKRINLDAATAQIARFIEAHCNVTPADSLILA